MNANKANRLQQKINQTEKQLAKTSSRKRQRQLAYKLTVLEGRLETLTNQKKVNTSNRHSGFLFTNFITWSHTHQKWVEMWKAVYTAKKNNYRALVTRNPDKSITAVAEYSGTGEFRPIEIGSYKPEVVLNKVAEFANNSNYLEQQRSESKRMADVAKLHLSRQLLKVR